MMTTPNFEQEKSGLAMRVRHVIDDMPHNLRSANHKLESLAREQPLVTAMVALAIGFFVARLLARRF